METEQLAIFDEAGNALGVAARDIVHKKGYWHQTFHCWFVSRRGGKDWIHLQIRSQAKKDFPGLLDITAAGHLLATETVEDGVREVEEELGIPIKFEELIPLGVIQDQIHLEGFTDNELCQVFLYKSGDSDMDFAFQKEEVAGMVQAEFPEFYKFCIGEIEKMQIEGYRMDGEERRERLKKSIDKQGLVPHSKGYLKKLAFLLKEQLGT